MSRGPRWEITNATCPEHQQPILPRDGEQTELNKTVEQVVQGVPVQVVANRLADLSPRYACVPSLGDEGDNQIGDRHMLTAFSITALNPGLKIDGVHLHYVCTPHIVCGATTDRKESRKFCRLMLLMRSSVWRTILS
jgi:hypothetical protein